VGGKGWRTPWLPRLAMAPPWSGLYRPPLEGFVPLSPAPSVCEGCREEGDRARRALRQPVRGATATTATLRERNAGCQFSWRHGSPASLLPHTRGERKLTHRGHQPVGSPRNRS
jgi:hypothetical protein